MKKGLLGLALAFAGGYVVGKYGEAIVEDVKARASDESFEDLLKELEKQKINIFKKDKDVDFEKTDECVTYSSSFEDEVTIETVNTEADEEFDAELEEIKKLYEEEESTEYQEN